MSKLKWIVVATFDTQEQAKQASAMLVSMAPRSYCFSAFDRSGHEVWNEQGREYGAHDVRL